MDFKLILTCGACPEQYDVVNRKTGEKIAYLRLRHGHFYAQYPYDGEIVYANDTIGDGIFDKEERAIHIGKALLAIRAAMDETKAKEEYNKAIEGTDDFTHDDWLKAQEDYDGYY
jgi:hypothetical protein